MTVRIRNLVASGPLLVPLTGGGWARLAPGEATEELPDVEVANNAKIDKLRRRRLIEVEEVTEAASNTASENQPEAASETAAEDRPPCGGSSSGKR